MKRRGIIASTTALAVVWCAVPIVGTPAPVQAAATYTSGLYEMNEPAGSTVLIDSSGNGRNGTIGSTAVAGVVFNGATAHRFLNRSPNLPPIEPQRLDTVPHTTLHNPDSQDYAISVRYRTSKSFGNLIQKGQNGTTGGYFKIELPYGRPTCLFKGVQNGRTVQRAIEAPLGNELNDNQWHTIKCERLSTRIALWIDGVEVKRLVGGTGTIANDRNLSIAGKSNCDQIETTCDYFVGDIDWVRIEKGQGVTNPPPVPSFTSSCTFLVCTFNAAATTDNGTISSYAWNYGTGQGTGTGINPTKTYSAGGTYTVTLTATDNGGASASTTRTIMLTANPPPVASFTSSCDFLECSFDASASTDNGTIQSYAWNFGDGTTGTGVAPTKTYSTGATRTVTLTVTDNVGATGSTTRQVTSTANTPPVASFTSDCTFLSCTFTSTSTDANGPIADHSWAIEGLAEPLTGSQVQHTFGADDTYTVTLTVTDGQGLTSTVADDVPVAANTAPVASFAYACIDLTCTLDASGTTDPHTPVNYSWVIDGVPGATGVEVDHTFPSDGSFRVTLTATDAFGAASTFDGNVEIAPNVAPVAGFTVTCDDLECTFTSTSSDPNGPDVPLTYAWDFGDGASSTQPNPVHSFPSAATYQVSLVVSDFAVASDPATDSVIVEITPNEEPTAGFTPTCDDLECTFTSTSLDTDGTITHAWDFGDGETSTETNPVHTYAAAGPYTVELTVTDNDGATASYGEVVEPTAPPNGLPTAAFSFDCDGLACDFDGTGSTDDGLLTYAWDFDGLGSADAATAPFIFPAPGDYEVTLTVTDAVGETDLVTQTVPVTEVAVDPISFVGQTTTGGHLVTHAANVPSNVQPGDGLLMFLSVGTAATVGTPAGVTGWTLVDTVSNGTGSTRLYSKVATAGNAGAQVRITLSTQSKAALTIVAYRGTAAAGPIATHTRALITASGTARTTPNATVTNPAWVVSYWAHRDSSTTALGAPGTVTARSAGSQTGGGRVAVLAADSNGTVQAGTYGNHTATAASASTWATAWTVVLAPA